MEINASFVSDEAIRLYNETSDKTHFPTKHFQVLQAIFLWVWISLEFIFLFYDNLFSYFR